jgi:hypothetical protein
MIIIRELKLYVVAVYVKQSGDACCGVIGQLYTLLVLAHLTLGRSGFHVGLIFCFLHDSHDAINGQARSASSKNLAVITKIISIFG